MSENTSDVIKIFCVCLTIGFLFSQITGCWIKEAKINTNKPIVYHYCSIDHTRLKEVGQ